MHRDCCVRHALLHSIVETEDGIVDIIVSGSARNEVEEIGIVQSVVSTNFNVTRNKNNNRLAIDRWLNINSLGSVCDRSQTLELGQNIRASHDLGSLKGHHGPFVLNTQTWIIRKVIHSFVYLCVICGL